MGNPNTIRKLNQGAYHRHLFEDEKDIFEPLTDLPQTKKIKDTSGTKLQTLGEAFAKAKKGSK